jgi:acetyl-CoA acetyltransferase
MGNRGAGQPLAAVVGVAESDLGATDKSILELHAQASLRALDEAGLSLTDVDALFTNGASRFPATLVAEYLGIQPHWTDSTMAGGSSYEIFIGHAAQAISAGAIEVALISYGSNQRSQRSRRLDAIAEPQFPEAQFQIPYGPLFPISLYAMAAQRHMFEFGTTEYHLAEVAVAAREWALRNPVAFTYGMGPLLPEDVLASPLVSTPLHAKDCCLVTDGGGAVVLTSMERARDLRKVPVTVLGFGERTTNSAMAQIPSLTTTGAVQSGKDAFTMAGLTPADVDVVEIYDSFTITVLLTLEALGFCPKGESGPFLADGRSRPGGAFPMNTSGGGLSYCHPGMFGIFLAIEAVRQLRGECGQRQVSDAEVALAHGTGGVLSSHATVLFGVDR